MTSALIELFHFSMDKENVIHIEISHARIFWSFE